MTDPPKRKRHRFQFGLRTLFVMTTLFAVVCSFLACYYSQAKIEGVVGYNACACGFSGARIADGKVILVHDVHDTPAGTVVANIKIEGGVCILNRFDEDGLPGSAERLEIDHLGAKDTFGDQQIYVIIVESWKLYPWRVVAWIKNLFR